MSFVSFIIPTVGRDTLTRALRSLVGQTDADWQAMVIADAVEAWHLAPFDPRIFSVNLPEKVGGGGHCSGQIRNLGMTMMSSEWFGFVDDDDRLDHRYVRWLREEAKVQDIDVVIFRMMYQPARHDGVIFLPNGKGLEDGYVGISFAVRSSFVRGKNIWFETEECEDNRYLQRLQRAGARMRWSQRIAYYVRH